MIDKTIVVLGFDFGMKYIGIATGQSLTKTATPLTSIQATDGIPDWLELAELIANWKPGALIVGIPLNMDDSTQLMTHRAAKFANRLRDKFNLPVHLVDERLSTWEAKQKLNLNQNQLTSKQLTLLNAEAAAIMLAQWLNE